jgi:hypothetical protein
MLEHARLGTIMYAVPVGLSAFHHNAADAAADELRATQDEILRVPMRDGIRSIRDPHLLERIYVAGASLVVSVVLAVQHLCEEIERSVRLPVTGATVEDRLRSALALAQLPDFRREAGYEAFSEIVHQRHAVEHPTVDRYYSGADWGHVPFAWFCSERPLLAYDRYDEWFGRLFDAWEMRRHEIGRERGPQTFEILQRGVRSDRSFKKPPPE